MSRVARARTALALATRRRIDSLEAGVHLSTRVGRSMDFNDLRAYVVGDDVSDIDWRTSARHGSLLVRRTFAERQVTLLLVVATDAGLAAMANTERTKADVLGDCAATLGVMATGHGDRVGLVWWDGHRPRVERPSGTAPALEAMLRLVTDTSGTDAPAVDLPALLETAANSLRRRAVVAVLCDTVDVDEALEAGLRRLVARHEVLLLTVEDLDPTEAATLGLATHPVDGAAALEATFLTDDSLAAELAADRHQRSTRLSSLLTRLGITHRHIATPDEAVTGVVELARRRHRARR